MPTLESIPRVLQEYDFPLTWAIEVDLSNKKAETIINSFNIIKTTRDKISKISHNLLKSFFLWFLQDTNKKYNSEAKRELEEADKLTREWEREMKIGDYDTFQQDYLDGVDYVITGMKLLLEASEGQVDVDELVEKMPNPPVGRMRAGLLHVKQEFFRPFVDEFDRRVEILEEIRKINKNDSRACLYLAKTLGQKRKMENFLSAPTQKEMDLLIEGNKIAGGRDLSILIELCFCLAQYIKNNRDVRYPLRFHQGAMSFMSERMVADFINKETTNMWNQAAEAAPLYCKLAEIQSSLLPMRYRHPTVSPLALVNRALEKYAKYSKALHRKAKILFKLKRYEEGVACLEAAFKYSETNCDALCDLVFRLLRKPEASKLVPIFTRYCNDRGENLWGKRKTATLFYLAGCYLWMTKEDHKPWAVWLFLQAEKRNPNPTFYFQNLEIQKSNYKWHNARDLNFSGIIQVLKCSDPTDWNEEDLDARNCLIAKLKSLMER